MLLGVCLLVACGPASPLAPANPSDGPAPSSDAGPTAAAPDAGAPDAGDPGLPDAGPAKKGPPYPIVFAHGFFGFDTFAGLDFLTYFFEVEQELAQRGEPLTFFPTVDPFNDSQTRSLALERQLEAILARTGHAKVNLIAHSQGGLDARLVAARRPELISAIITVATPHRGTAVSDVAAPGLGNPRARAVVDALVNLIAAPLWSEARATSSVTRALAQFERKAMADFNAAVRDPPEVEFFSVAGRSALRRDAAACEVPGRPSFITDYDWVVDPINPLLSTTQALLSPNPFDPVANDGLVPVESAKWGTFLGCIPADHLDEIGQIGGVPPGLVNRWRHKPFYTALVRFLRARGH